ncbi:MAG: hypothetical protein WC546_02475 [Candidatus Omnitrophota bacterium]
MARPLFPIILSLIPIVFLLSLSFFILVVLANVKTNALKIFGYVIIALIWLTTILVFGAGISRASKGRYPGMLMRKAIMEHQKMGMMPEEGSGEGMNCPKMKQK